MKKFTAIIMTALLVLSLTACSSTTESESAASSDPAVTAEAAASSEAESAEEVADEPTAEQNENLPTIEPSEEPADGAETTEKETAEPPAPETSTPETTAPSTTPAETTPATTPAATTSATTKPAATTPATTKPVETKPTTTTAEPEPEEPVVEEAEISDPATLLNSVYALFSEDERFPVTGGDFSSGELIEEAAAFSLSEPEALDSVTGFPAAQIGSIDSAATMMHMMNANTFTGGAFHVVDGTDIDALNSAVRDNIQARMWMCGFPEKLIVVNVGDYLVCAFGKNFAIDAFSAHLVEAYPNAVIAIEEPIL